MANLEQVFGRITEIKKQQKDIKTSYKDALVTSQSYQDVVEELKKLKDKKKNIEQAMRGDFSYELQKLEDLKIDLASEQEVLSDIALTKLMKGESISLKDKYDVEYEPVFSVKFKKIR